MKKVALSAFMYQSESPNRFRPIESIDVKKQAGLPFKAVLNAIHDQPINALGSTELKVTYYPDAVADSTTNVELSGLFWIPATNANISLIFTFTVNTRKSRPIPVQPSIYILIGYPTELVFTIPPSRLTKT